MGSVSREQMDRSTLDTVSAGLHWSFRMSRQMAPWELMLGWYTCRDTTAPVGAACLERQVFAERLHPCTVAACSRAACARPAAPGTHLGLEGHLGGLEGVVRREVDAAGSSVGRASMGLLELRPQDLVNPGPQSAHQLAHLCTRNCI